MPSAFLIQPISREFEPVRVTIQAAANRAGVSLSRADSLPSAGSIIEAIYQQLESADLIIADLSEANPNVMYELGFVHAAKRPVILISSGLQHVPFDIASLRVIHYGRDPADLEIFKRELQQAVEMTLRDPSRLARRPTTKQDVNRLFISYSHRDRVVLERLLVHLKPLEREGLIDAWNDTQIETGADWKLEVEAALEHARAAILLVTADFLASDFIVNNELPTLLRGAESKGTTIIPVIVKPCRYTRDKTLRRLQAINNPALSLMSLNEVEQEQLLDKIAATVEHAMRPLR